MALSSLRVFIEEWFLRDLRRAEEQSRGWRSQVSSTTMMQARTSADDRAKCKKQDHTAKIQFVTSLQEGQSWQTPATKAGLQISQSSAYRLWGAFRHRGETALSDGRHGHPSKLRGAARAFLEEQCRQAPQTPSSVIQVELRERFDLDVSVSQINRVRAALGLSNRRKSQQQGKKTVGAKAASERTS